MTPELLEILACPACRADLSLEQEHPPPGYIEEGQLVCAGCAAEYSVIGGIPRFESDAGNSSVSTAGHFEREFTMLSESDRDIEPPELAEYYFFTRSGLDRDVFTAFEEHYFRTDLLGVATYDADYSSIEDKVVLDAGCGPGRFTRVVGQKARLAVGLELGGHVDRAARFCEDLPNVQFVQGSVLRPPFKPGVFDLVFSLGVLHHTPAPRHGVQELAKLVRPQGEMSVWVYAPEYWNGPIRGPIAKTMNRFVSRLPGPLAHRFCSRILYPLGRLQEFLARRRWSKLLFAPLFLLPVPRSPRKEIMINTIYDYYGPRLISTHRYEEVEGWMTEAGLSGLRRGEVPTSVVGTRGTEQSR